MTHRQHMTNTEQDLAVMSAPLMACPNCGHGIDPHGTDPGGICGVGDENRDRCPCVLSPNAVAWLLMAAAWDEGRQRCVDDMDALFDDRSAPMTPNPYRAPLPTPDAPQATGDARSPRDALGDTPGSDGAAAGIVTTAHYCRCATLGLACGHYGRMDA